MIASLFAIASLPIIMIIFDGGGVYDPDPSADFRYKEEKKMKIRQKVSQIKNKFLGK